MGRAYEVRKASIQKTGAVKSKLYSMYAREIYAAAKQGGIDPNTNASLKRLIDKAKKEQVPSDIVKRAIDKVSSGVDENYVSANYEIFGPNSSTLIIECLTDNVNRTISDIRTVTNKCHIKIGAMGSVNYMYDHLSVIVVSGTDEETVMNTLIENDVDVIDIEVEDTNIVVTGNPKDLISIKETIEKIDNINVEMDEVTYLPKDKVKLSGDDLEIFNKACTMFEDIDDVQNVYHNVELD
jgi:Uncharacterized conserved protein